ncbi:cell filamentation protein Fic [Paeniglutamicibacter gangotriensis]|uniref:protein adenylyltransferase n=1 Tax=Paeniglutamicibacter gangotriensis TaxID=254787 RepID=A0A5B0EDK6_9MICC|nr:Fic family protein [Paeniglutamicibacter gangotriensis]KAA0977117.1 cell filamentation protein Fic [Paeniglutamicibacter gangotriensis]
MGSTDFDSSAPDPYLDPTTGILRNLVGATTSKELAAAKADLVAVRVVQLRDSARIEPSRDLQEFRTIDLTRPNNEPFCPVNLIERAAASISRELTEDNHLQGLERREFEEKLSYYYDSFNYIHPFREGNGRTQREFWNRVAEDAGWFIDWGKVHGEQLNEASQIAREEQNYQPLIVMFSDCISPLST